jgi:hypothetical protein
MKTQKTLIIGALALLLVGILCAGVLKWLPFHVHTIGL